MPTVPTFPGQQVARAPQPNVRIDPGAPEAAFGGPSGLDLGGVAHAAQQVWAQERQKADEIALVGADGQLAKLETGIQYDPQVLGILTKQGQEAFTAQPKAMELWKQGVSKIAAGLTNDTQRRAFERAAMSREADLDSAVQRHVAGERQQFDAAQTDDYVRVERNAAMSNYQDPERVALSVERQKAVLTGFARRTGKPAEWLQAQIEEAVSKTHLGVLELMAAKDDLKTTDYLKAHRKDLAGNDLVSAERTTEEATVRGEAQREADAIIQTSSDRLAAEEKAKAIKNPKVRQLAEERLDHHYNVVKAAEAEKRDDIYRNGLNLLDRNRGANPRAIIPPADWQKLTEPERAGLIRYSQESVPNNDQKWLTFLDLRPEQLGALNQSQFFTQYRTYLDKAHAERADLMWAAARDGMTSGKWEHWTEIMSDHDMLFATIRNAGLLGDPNKSFAKLSNAEATFVNNFEMAAQARVSEFEKTQLGGKRKASPDEKRKIFDEMTHERVFIDKPWARDPEKLKDLVLPDERSRAYVPISKISAPERSALDKFIRSRGLKVTDDKIQRAYAAQLLDGRDIVEQLADPHSPLNGIINEGGAGVAVPNMLVTPPSGVQPDSADQVWQQRDLSVWQALRQGVPLSSRKGGSGRDF